MNLSFTVPSNFRENLLSAKLNFARPDTFNAILMRAGFSFSAANHKALLNVTATTGAIDYGIVAATKTITRVIGAPHNHGTLSFITDGFVVGNYITLTGTNAGTYVVRSVTATTMRVDLVGAATLVDETATAQTITCQDEYATGGGYTRIPVTFDLTGSVLTLDTFDLTSFGAADLALSGGIIIYDDTATGDPIVCFAKTSTWALNF